MVLLLLLLIAAVPLIGVVWIIFYGSVTTVDGLFMSLILLTMSGIVGTTALFELRRRMSGQGVGMGAAAALAGQSLYPGELEHRGKVQDVVFFESNVGQPNKSIVTLSDGGGAPQTLVVEGDMRNALPIGQKVHILLRKEGGQNVLINLSYS
jgi:hypothetical protein